MLKKHHKPDLIVARSSPEGESQDEGVDAMPRPEIELIVLMLGFLAKNMMPWTEWKCPRVVRLLGDASGELAVAERCGAKMRGMDIAPLAADHAGKGANPFQMCSSTLP